MASDNAPSILTYYDDKALTLKKIETVMSRTLSDLGEAVRDVDFILDVGAIATIVQPETDKLLKDL
jgi:hypothetical protein